MLNINNMDHNKKVLVWVFGMLHQCAESGHLQGGAVGITPRGLSQFDQLKASGFVPSRQDVMDCLKYGEIADDAQAGMIADLLLNPPVNEKGQTK